MFVSPYKACCIFRALKLHFTTEYDFLKYNGKIKYTKEQFEQNSQKFVYEKLAKRYNSDDIYSFIISNLVESDEIWIRELVNNIESVEIFNDYKKRIQALSYVFETDLDILFKNRENVFSVKDGELPILIKKLLRKEVCMETVILMENYLGFFEKWDKKLNDDLIWPKLKFKILKYKRLLKFDDDKYRRILKQSIKNL